MQRIAVVGSAGSGKTTLAQELSATLDLEQIELDAIFHQPGWEPLPDDVFMARVTNATSGDRWVTCGNYQRVSKPIIWRRADTVVWLDLPKAAIMRALVRRSVRRAWSQEELWNGNRERLLNFVKTKKEENILLWAWTQYDSLRDRYLFAMADPSWAHLEFVHLRSRAEVSAWLARVATDPGRASANRGGR